MKHWINIAFFILGSTSVHSQKNTTASGGECSGSGGTVSYSVGQIDHAFRTNGSYIITEGVQQPYALSHPTVIEDRAAQDMVVFPNPSTGQFILNVQQYNGLQFMVYDVSGRLFEIGRVDDLRTVIDLSHLADGAYILSITENGLVAAAFNLHLIK